MSKVVSVLLPLLLKADFDYLLPENLEAQAEVGKRVTVPLGKNKVLTGIITEIKDQTEVKGNFRLKNVGEILDQYPVVSRQLISLYRWIAEYYMCSTGEALKASLPAGLKLENEWFAERINGTRLDQNLTDNEYLVLEALQLHPKIPLSEIEELTGSGAGLALLQRMEEKGVITLSQSVAGSYVAKYEKFVHLIPPYDTSEGLKQAFESVKKAP